MEEFEKEVIQRLTAVESSLKTEHKRLDHIENLVDSIQAMTVEMKHIREDITRISSKVSTLEGEPAKRWEMIVAAVIGAIGGALGSALIGLILK